MVHQPTTLNTNIPQTPSHLPYSPPSLSLSTMTTTTKHSTINTTSPTPTTSHNDMRQNTTPAHTRITTTTNIPRHALLKNTASTHQNPHHHHYAHPQKHLYQPLQINYPQPRQNPKLVYTT